MATNSPSKITEAAIRVIIVEARAVLSETAIRKIVERSLNEARR